MAFFSYEHNPFLTNSTPLVNSANKIPRSLEEDELNSPLFTYFPSETMEHNSMDDRILQNQSIGSDNASFSANQMTHSLKSSETKTQMSDSSSLENKKRKNVEEISLPSQSKDENESKGRKYRKCNKVKEEKKKSERKNDKRNDEEPPTGYIHVRARRGQATDSHSLAERVRREKISERMKMLQELVPGCNKVTGKALMLDEIINYVQSLQNQVEFLSMKLASVNPFFYDFSDDFNGYITKSEKQESLASPLQSLQHSDQTQQNTFEETQSSIVTMNSYPILNNLSSFLHEQRPTSSSFSQENGNSVRNVEEQRQRLISQIIMSNIYAQQ